MGTSVHPEASKSIATIETASASPGSAPVIAIGPVIGMPGTQPTIVFSSSLLPAFALCRIWPDAAQSVSTRTSSPGAIW